MKGQIPMKTLLRRVGPCACSIVAPVILAGCLTAPQQRAAVRDDTVNRITVGTLQQHLRTGMTNAEVVQLLGPPNIVATDAERREVWTYDKTASESVASSSSISLLPLIFGSVGGALGSGSHATSATSHSQRTLTVIVKFDGDKRVRDFGYHTSAF